MASKRADRSADGFWGFLGFSKGIKFFLDMVTSTPETGVVAVFAVGVVTTSRPLLLLGLAGRSGVKQSCGENEKAIEKTEIQDILPQ
jgi:hypothetical protein